MYSPCNSITLFCFVFFSFNLWQKCKNLCGGFHIYFNPITPNPQGLTKRSQKQEGALSQLNTHTRAHTRTHTCSETWASCMSLLVLLPGIFAVVSSWARGAVLLGSPFLACRELDVVMTSSPHVSEPHWPNTFQREAGFTLSHPY